MRASSEYNLAVKHPEIAEEWHPSKNGTITLSEVPPNSGKKVRYWWLCKNNHEWKDTIDNRAIGHGCRKCYLKHDSHE